METLLGGLLETPLLQLHLLCQTTPLDVGEEEALDEVLDEGLIVVIPPLEALQVLVHLLLPQVGHNTGLPIRSPLDGIVENPVEVAIDCALVHLHDLLGQTLLPRTDYLLGVATTGLLHLPPPAFVLDGLDLLLDPALLSYPHQLLREVVQSVSYYLPLQPLVHRVPELLLVLLQQHLLRLVLVQVRNLSDDQQLLNQSQPLLLPLVHYVLLPTAPQNPLQEDYRHLPLDALLRTAGLLQQVGLREGSLPLLVIHVGVDGVVRGAGTCYDIPEGLDVVTNHLVLLLLRLQLLVDILLRHLQGLLVRYRQTRLLVVHLGSLLRWGLKLSQTVVTVQGHRLHLVLVCEFVQSQPLPTDPRIDLGAVVGIVMDDIPGAEVLVLLLPGLQQLPEKFDLLPLDLGNEPVLLLSLPYLDVLDPLRILIGDVLLPLHNRLLHQLQPLPVHLLYLVLLLRPLPHLLVLHQPPTHVETRLVRYRRQRVLEPRPLAVQLDVVQHVNSRRESIPKTQVLEGQHLRFLTLAVDLLRRVGVGLAIGLTVVSLNVHLLGRTLP